jgi:hypothetical protein
LRDADDDPTGCSFTTYVPATPSTSGEVTR